jgi:hypothetical protein
VLACAHRPEETLVETLLLLACWALPFTLSSPLAAPQR